MKRSAFLTTFLFAMLLVLVAAMPLAAAVRSVPFEYQTIQDAVNNAVSGDVVSISSGTYAEAILVEGKDLSFQSAGGEVVIRGVNPLGCAEATWWNLTENPFPPIFTLKKGDASTVSASFNGITFQATESEEVVVDPVYGTTETFLYNTAAAIFAGSGVDLTVEDCQFNGGFMVALLGTSYEDLFEDIEFYDFDPASVTMPLPVDVTVTNSTFDGYYIAGVGLAGPLVTGRIAGSSFLGDTTFEVPMMASGVDPMKVLSSMQSSLMEGSLFTSGLGAQEETIDPDDVMTDVSAAGVLLVNGNYDLVTLTDNVFSRNLIGVGVLKEVEVIREDQLQPSRPNLTVSTIFNGDNVLADNLVGVAAIGGLDIDLVWSPDQYLDIYDVYPAYEPMGISISDQENIERNLVGVILAGSVSADVTGNTFTDNMLIGVAGLGSLVGSSISDNLFTGTIGANILVGLGSEGISLSGSTDAPEITPYVDISNNVITGFGSVEGAHELISSLFGLEGMSMYSSMALSRSLALTAAEYGPFGFLPVELQDALDQAEEAGQLFTLAGVILLDGSSLVRVSGNTVTDALLGVSVLELGLAPVSYCSVSGNTITGSLSGLTVLGAGEGLNSLMNSGSSLESQGMYYGIDTLLVRNNLIEGNHVGVLNGLSVKNFLFTGNRVRNNYVQGMINFGLGEWFFGSTEPLGGSVMSEYSMPAGRILSNTFRNNGQDCDLLDLPLGTESLGTYLKGGLMVVDVDTRNLMFEDADTVEWYHGIQVRYNNFLDNENYGMAVLGRKSNITEPLEASEVLSTDYWLDGRYNFWGDNSGPSSYFGSDGTVVFSDPMTLVDANGAGQAISGIILEENGSYFPNDGMVQQATYVRPMNCVLFDEWVGKGLDPTVEGVAGGEVSGEGDEEESTFDLGGANDLGMFFNAFPFEGFNWNLIRFGETPDGIPDLPEDHGGYYRMNVINSWNMESLTVRFYIPAGYSVPDMYWFDQESGQWVLLVPSAETREWLEFTFSDSTTPSLDAMFPYRVQYLSLGASTAGEETAYFAQTGSYPSGGGGGCSVSSFAPAALMLLLPLMMLAGKK